MGDPPTPTTVTLDLVLDIASEPITGALRNIDGYTTTFVGWLELSVAIEASRATTTPPASRQEGP